ncbi:hypothetical protein T06_6314 [Trichinella sp. T6]|nr:hypothetical protein T06_6314 [Trichinella sp. T6]
MKSTFFMQIRQRTPCFSLLGQSSLGKSSLPLPTYYPTLKRLNCAFSVLTNIRDYPSFFLSIVAVFYESDLSSPSRSRHLVTRE